MASIRDEDVQEAFQLFDTEGSGIKIKDIAIVMRSLGLNPPAVMLSDMLRRAREADKE